MRKVKAFTLEANGRIGTIRTPVTIVSKNGDKIRCVAIWDTGADTTHISRHIADILSLKTIGTMSCNAIGGIIECYEYFVDILLPSDIAINDIAVLDFEGMSDCDVLIGMDIICNGDFAVTNADETTWVTFRVPPCEKHLDYKVSIEQ